MVLPSGVLHMVFQHLSLVLLKVTEEKLGLEGLRMRQCGLYLMGLRRQVSSQGAGPTVRMQHCLAALDCSAKSQGSLSQGRAPSARDCAPSASGD